MNDKEDASAGQTDRRIGDRKTDGGGAEVIDGIGTLQRTWCIDKG